MSRALTHETLEALVRGFRNLRGEEPRLAFFLDEEQVVAGWQRWLRAALDRPARSLFVVTGSNAELLSGEMSSLLTGRHQRAMDEFYERFPQAEEPESQNATGAKNPSTTLLGAYPAL